MSDLSQVVVLDALDAVYQNVTAVAGGLGAPLPASWDDVTAALKGTGREPLT